MNTLEVKFQPENFENGPNDLFTVAIINHAKDSFNKVAKFRNIK